MSIFTTLLKIAEKPLFFFLQLLACSSRGGSHWTSLPAIRWFGGG